MCTTGCSVDGCLQPPPLSSRPQAHYTLSHRSHRRTSRQLTYVLFSDGVLSFNCTKDSLLDLWQSMHWDNQLDTSIKSTRELWHSEMRHTGSSGASIDELHVINWEEAQVVDSHPYYTQQCTLGVWHIRSRRKLNRDVGLLPSTYNLNFFHNSFIPHSRCHLHWLTTHLVSGVSSLHNRTHLPTFLPRLYSFSYLSYNT